MGAYTDDVLFIHIPKTGGTAVKQYMADHVPGTLWPDPLDDELKLASRLPIGHIPLRDIPSFTGRPLDSWEQIVAVIRNPYEQQVSQWWFWHTRYATGDEHPHSVHAAMHPRIHSWLLDPFCDFHMWYEDRFHTDEPLRPRSPEAIMSLEEWGGYYWYWLSVDGVLPPNLKILKQEELEHTVPLTLAPYIDGPPPDLPRVNEGQRIDWRAVYTAGGVHGQRSLEIVTAKFKWCFENKHYNVLEVRDGG